MTIDESNETRNTKSTILKRQNKRYKKDKNK